MMGCPGRTTGPLAGWHKASKDNPNVCGLCGRDFSPAVVNQAEPAGGSKA